MTKEQLIQALESATEGSRELDAFIHALVVNPPVMVDGGSWRGDIPATYEPMTSVLGRVNGADLAEFTGCPRYTTSLDAAMTLVPEGWSWKLIHETGDDSYLVVIRNAPTLAHVAPAFVVGGATAALALCSAFIRARPA